MKFISISTFNNHIYFLQFLNYCNFNVLHIKSSHFLRIELKCVAVIANRATVVDWWRSLFFDVIFDFAVTTFWFFWKFKKDNILTLFGLIIIINSPAMNMQVMFKAKNMVAGLCRVVFSLREAPDEIMTMYSHVPRSDSTCTVLQRLHFVSIFVFSPGQCVCVAFCRN
jgi:hypothetical protein